MSQRGITIQCPVHFQLEHRGRKALTVGMAPIPAPPRLPRVTKLLALAHKFERLIAAGAVADYAELARLGHVTRARLTQIMNLLLLAPDIQEEILFLPPVADGRDPLIIAQLQPIAAAPDWAKQRRSWLQLQKQPQRPPAVRARHN
jgi:hypothetical protein